MNYHTMRRKALAFFRRHDEGDLHGYVVFYRGKLCAWTFDLHRPVESSLGRPNGGYVAGCLAVEMTTGEMWRAVGGDYYHGAQRWERIVDVAIRGLRRRELDQPPRAS